VLDRSLRPLKDRGLEPLAQRLPAALLTLTLVGGAVARRAGTASDLGGYLDIVVDTGVYDAVPRGLAYRLDTTLGWAMAALLLASSYVNTISWMGSTRWRSACRW
jgi:phosphatidylglycerophosphate synthase